MTAMAAEHEALIARYLDGCASDADVERLEQLVCQDESVRLDLLQEASIDVHLRQVFRAASPADVSNVPSAHRRPRLWLMAAMLAVAVVGWAAAVHFNALADRQQAATMALQDRLETTQRQVAALQESLDESRQALLDAMASPTAPAAVAEAPTAPEVIDKRGLVLLLPQEQGSPAVSISAGTEVPEGRSIWTCPWGAAGTRYADGTSVSLSRSTTAAFKEADGTRRIRLHSGILSVERYPKDGDAAPVVIETGRAAVTLESGLVTVVAEEGRTIVEVGERQADVTRIGDGVTATVVAGRYLIVEGGGPLVPVRGRLRLTPTTLDAPARPTEQGE